MIWLAPTLQTMPRHLPAPSTITMRSISRLRLTRSYWPPQRTEISEMRSTLHCEAFVGGDYEPRLLRSRGKSGVRNRHRGTGNTEDARRKRQTASPHHKTQRHDKRLSLRPLHSDSRSYFFVWFLSPRMNCGCRSLKICRAPCILRASSVSPVPPWRSCWIFYLFPTTGGFATVAGLPSET